MDRKRTLSRLVHWSSLPASAADDHPSPSSQCLGLAWLSRRFKEKTFISMIPFFYGLPLLITLATLPDGGRHWVRSAVTPYKKSAFRP